MRASHPLATIMGSVAGAVATVSCLAFTFVVLSTLVDVFLRYFFSRPILGVIELNECMMPIMVFMAIALTQRHRGHIRVSLVLNRMKPGHRRILEALSLLVGFLFILVMGWETGKDALTAFRRHESVLVGLKVMPIWWAKFALPIGLWSLCLQYLVDIATMVGWRGSGFSGHPTG